MVDRLDTLFASLNEVDVPLTWEAVGAVAEVAADHEGARNDRGGEAVHLAPDLRVASGTARAAEVDDALGPALAIDDEVEEPVRPGGGSGDCTRQRRLLAMAALVAAVMSTVAGVVGVARDSSTAVATDPSPDSAPNTTARTSASVTSPTGATATTANGSTNPPSGTESTEFPTVPMPLNNAVRVWTGSEYLVWSGELVGEDDDNDSSFSAGGWRFNPATNKVTSIPTAPIPARDNAAGAWTGTEMIVCCGRSEDTPSPTAPARSSAAAYDPTTNTWRTLAPPPVQAGTYAVGAAWTGTEMLVIAGLGGTDPRLDGTGGSHVLAYDPTSDEWRELAHPMPSEQFSELTWTGSRLVLWSQRAGQSDAGQSYDPSADVWTRLPDLPEPGLARGSTAWSGDQLVVWGLAGRSGREEAEPRPAGFRLRADESLSGELQWQPIADAPLPKLEPYQGSAGSQTLVADPDSGEIIVHPITGYESGVGGVLGGPPNLLAYNPDTDVWRVIGVSEGRFHPELTVGDGRVYGSDPADPVVTDLDG